MYGVGRGFGESCRVVLHCIAKELVYGRVLVVGMSKQSDGVGATKSGGSLNGLICYIVYP